jgi:SRSO17 transposase
MSGLETVVAQITDVPAVRTVSAAALTGLAETLPAYLAQFAPLFPRRTQAAWAAVYLRGLLTADVPRKNAEALVLRLLGAGPAAEAQVRALQYFLSTTGWADAPLLHHHHRLVAATLGEADGVLIIDGHETPKQGTHSVGVARQWCGHTGKQDNCQAGVYLGYASRQGYTLLDRRLYLPQAWFDDDHADAWTACRIPPETVFQTKHELAGELVEQLQARRVIPARWVLADEGYGDSPALLARWAATGLWYLAEVRRDTQVWFLTEPDGQTPRAAPQTWVPPQQASKQGPVPTVPRLHPASAAKQAVEAWAAAVPATQWEAYRLLEGSKGPLVAEFTAVRVITVRDRLPGPASWLLVRRTLGTAEEPPVYKYYLSNAPASTPLAALVRVSGWRWPIEATFAECGQEVGLNDYEVRTWPGWHHHTVLVILAHFFLVRLQRRLDPREGGLVPRPGALATADHPVGPAAAAAAATAPAGAEPAAGARPAARPAAVAGLGCGSGTGVDRLPPAPQVARLLGPSPQTPLVALGLERGAPRRMSPGSMVQIPRTFADVSL